MEPSSIAIQFRDYITLVVVWELHDGYWEILSVVRLNAVIALVRSSPTTRLVFPTGVLPSGVWGGVCKKQPARANHKKADLSPTTKERLLALLKDAPGQSKDSLTERLGIRDSTLVQLLRYLEKVGDIYHRPHPMRNKTKLYYTGAKPTKPSIGATSDPKILVRSARSSPPLTVYFVAPRTLQGIKR